jgi:hypothetical protein
MRHLNAYTIYRCGDRPIVRNIGFSHKNFPIPPRSKLTSRFSISTVFQMLIHSSIIIEFEYCLKLECLLMSFFFFGTLHFHPIQKQLPFSRVPRTPDQNYLSKSLRGDTLSGMNGTKFAILSPPIRLIQTRSGQWPQRLSNIWSGSENFTPAARSAPNLGPLLGERIPSCGIAYHLKNAKARKNNS